MLPSSMTDHHRSHAHGRREKTPPKQPLQAQWSMKGRFSLHSSWETLVASLEADCPLCWTYWRAIRPSPIASTSDERVVDFQATITYAHFDIGDDFFNLWVRLEGTGLKATRIRLNITKTSREIFEERNNPIPAQHTAQSAAEVANRWIGVCDKNHPSCLARATPPSDAKMPTRLLDLGTSDSTTWRIIETQQERFPYVALSHRWTENTPTLLQKNYDAYCDSQPDSILPQNYRDMLDICRAIPIRSIWIDSLCIIQDDNGADFRHEAPIMLDVYRYAFLTLMILWEFSDSTVFRHCRPSTIARPRPQFYKRSALTEAGQDSLFTYLKNIFLLEAPVTSQDPVSNAQKYAFVRVENTGSYNFDVNNAPINNRAWVLQERCLSRRILCLGNEELYWECEGDSSGPLIANETSPSGVPHISRREGLGSLTCSDNGEYWNLLVEQYTACHLTFEEDRLVAFSGIARAVAKSTGDTCLAGIWLETWMQDLLWVPDIVREQPARVKPTTMGTQSMILPSWSWLSFYGSIIPGLLVANGEGPRISPAEPNSFKSDRFDCLALLSQTTVTPPEIDPYVFFHRAILRVRCLIIPMELTGIAAMHKLSPSFRITQDIGFNSTGLDCLRLIPCGEKEDGYAVFNLSFSKPLNKLSRYFFIPLFLRRDKYQEAIKFGPDDTEGHGIIVEETATDGERQYIRVGRWQEDMTLPSQLGPLISNTIVQQGIGETVSDRSKDFTELERSFDSKMHEYAVRHASSMINFPRNCTSQLDQEGVNVKDENGISIDENGQFGENLRGKHQGEKEQMMVDCVKCSDLPHFSSAKWSSISLIYLTNTMATKKLHVANLSWDTTKDDLLDAFSEGSEAERALVMRESNTGRSKGYGLVVFNSLEGAAITKKFLNNTKYA
ncbi:hypothetical protein FAGAP_12109 [Fusarium agapanthi]|uniref:RRM domain-containing protein n=1 Tax=Fusarium agapanthi TaxID=1803897 RepID=A0A9P5AXX9_9HYPO|nr:hypothetical protein FAGAP_12109 [Fusarium agapanthi]